MTIRRPAWMSRASERMLAGVAEYEATGQVLPPRCVDYRVYPSLMSRGLVAFNIREGVCFTPKGRGLWREITSNGEEAKR